MNDLELERLRAVAYGATATPRERLILTVDFLVRVTNHAAHLDERDAMELGALFVEKLDAYLESRKPKEWSPPGPWQGPGPDPLIPPDR